MEALDFGDQQRCGKRFSVPCGLLAKPRTNAVSAQRKQIGKQMPHPLRGYSLILLVSVFGVILCPAEGFVQPTPSPPMLLRGGGRSRTATETSAFKFRVITISQTKEKWCEEACKECKSICKSEAIGRLCFCLGLCVCICLRLSGH